MNNWNDQLQLLKQVDFRALARVISLVENEADGYETFMQSLPANNSVKVIGITGPPGAGKSTLTDALIGSLIKEEKKIGVLCVDPSSPFNFGSLLGDRIRMSEWYNNQKVFIRSLATRGSLGGLHPKIIEITDVMKAAGFDYIFIETVGVGQSEVEIAGLADVTVVVLVPEGGDVIQTMKAGLMEIADIFVVNKSDRPDADAFVKNLSLMSFNNIKVPVIKTIAVNKTGIDELLKNINAHTYNSSDKKNWLLTDKAYQLIQKKRMSGIDKIELKNLIEIQAQQRAFNLYNFVNNFCNNDL